MKVYLRHAATGHYYNGQQEWVSTLKDARDFREVEAALDAVTGPESNGMILVLWENGHEQQYSLTAGPGERPRVVAR